MKLLNVLWYPWLLALWVMLRGIGAHHPHTGLDTEEGQGPGDTGRHMGQTEDSVSGEAEEAVESWHNGGEQI